jgi:cytochrome b561
VADLGLAEAHITRHDVALSADFLVLKRDNDHMHMHHGAPLTELNETAIIQWHAPTPPSYWSIDIEDRDPSVARYPGLMVLHVVFMTLAFFVALPVGIAMRALKHSWHGVVVVAFYSLCALGCASGALYTKLTPDMYEGSTHASHGYLVLILSLCLSAVDITRFLVRLYAFIKSRSKFALKPFWRNVVLGQNEYYDVTNEYTGLDPEEPSEFDVAELKPVRLAESTEPLHVRRNQPIATIHTQDLDDADDDETAPWVNNSRSSQGAIHTQSERIVFEANSPQGSRHSDETLHDFKLPGLIEPQAPLIRISQGAFATLERALVFAAFGMTLSGIVVYTGGCRESYVNGCLAHLIKGGIFWCYGLVTFARYLGSFSELGWAWNISPTGEHVSAEFVESLVIFLYGITNTWMERFGVHSGDPYTTKQVQHISIAIMFWFAGLIGMGIESKRVRRWLAASAVAAVGPAEASEPPSYRGSFNPFPALVIGVTGAAMSAHAQTYLFQVQIHELWGRLLLGFSVLRCFTYFFVWLGPPRSILPSRPPTEALASFFLACGGLVFIFSTEEITIAAMRKGRDDMMMFLNVAVAITCFAFCWAFSIVAMKGWLKSRSSPRYPPSAP